MLYVFGDSFSSPHEQLTQITNSNQSGYSYQSLEMNWCGIVSKELNGSATHINDAILGCPNEYIYQGLLRRFNEMQVGDQVIVQLSSYDRQWFIEDKPHLSNFESTVVSRTEIPKQTQKAIDMFYKNLYFEERYKIIYQAFVSAMFSAGVMLDRKGVKLLIIPGFHDISGIVGTLGNISFNEFDGEETMGLFYTKTADSRYNHLTERNHKTLADKVVKYFTAGEMIDLTTGFETSIYTKNNI
jgi:hypothetical protein